MSLKGNRTIAVVSGPENYEAVLNLLKKPIEEMNNMIRQNSIDVEGKICSGFGDYKSSLIVMGLNGAT